MAVLVAAEEGEPGEPEDLAKEGIMRAVAVMLIGSITFVMALFYLVNWPDPDIRRFSWRIIGDTISIFSAVLFFQACDGMVDKWFVAHGPLWWKIFVDFVHMLFWFMALQICTGIMSGATADFSWWKSFRNWWKDARDRFRTNMAESTRTTFLEPFVQKMNRENSESNRAKCQGCGEYRPMPPEKCGICFTKFPEAEALGEEEKKKIKCRTKGCKGRQRVPIFCSACGLRYVKKGWNLQGEHEDDEHDIQQRKMNLKCFAGLLAHTTGFAAINAWGTVQQILAGSRSPLWALLTVLFAFIALRLLFEGTDKLRIKALEMMGRPEERWAKEGPEALWDEEAEDAENDVLSLACSFLTIQAVRMKASGHLPDWDGELKPNSDKPWSEVLLLGMSSAFLLIMAAYLIKHWRSESNREIREAGTTRGLNSSPEQFYTSPTFKRRMHLIAQTYLMMCFSWCVVFMAKEMTAVWGFGTGPGEITDRVGMALGLSALSFVLIFCLDLAKDSEDTGGDADAAIIKIIGAQGLAIGFSWEQCFDTSVEVLAEGWSFPTFMKLILATFVCIIVVPAYRLYILPSVDHSQRIAEEADGLGEGDE
eukprot:CAMPEP_0170591380 /NCGR_PEP_ID=MMETSP0224-20130122/12373_1 /TAXON_ID=285029 /ORGANISM="Togula jolla, Strain CCCM 725" /LENGTH=592 /DNA_ID=CAMNT_0010915241 /DNA_START=100 /DNA_END=1878 /DNA_ORIENTATION=+